ncbi:MFS transporter [Derxia lacustris]|uniref:MFS transporter n=1 Tax=Derxia lacustris TaxID=764842 RepID=UPI000A17781B|nr:MFS transporter [Derxia lacustris]
MAEQLLSAPGRPSALALRRLLCALTATLVGLTQGFGLNLVSANLAAIQGSLGATAAEASWLSTAYFASALSSSLLLVKFRLHFGLQWFASLGLLFFLAVASLHLLADDLVSAVAARAALGLAAAPLSTLAVLYMIEAFPPRLAPVGLLLGFATLQLGAPLSRVVSTDLLEVGQWHGLFLLDVALALMSLAAIHGVRLAPAPTRPAFSRGDLVAFPLYAGGLALLSVALSQGRLRWWTDTPWLGVCLAAALGCIGLYALVELHRRAPMIDLRWLAQPYMLRFIAAVLLFRVVLSEQTVGVVGLMTVLGQSNEQMRLLFALASLALLAGFVLAIALAARGASPWLAPLAMALAMLAAWADADATALSRPEQFLATQALLALALGVFFSASCLLGFGPVVQDGSRNLVSFIAAFSAAQYLGSLLGSAWIATFVAERQSWHYAALAQHLSLADPQVATRIGQLARSVAPVVGDPAARGLQGAALLAQQVTREAFVLAYDDLFRAIALLAAALLPWLGWLGWRGWRRERAGRAAAPVTPAAPPSPPTLQDSP